MQNKHIIEGIAFDIDEVPQFIYLTNPYFEGAFDVYRLDSHGLISEYLATKTSKKDAIDYIKSCLLDEEEA